MIIEYELFIVLPIRILTPHLSNYYVRIEELLLQWRQGNMIKEIDTQFWNYCYTYIKKKCT